jgi:hypothetical protein
LLKVFCLFVVVWKWNALLNLCVQVDVYESGRSAVEERKSRDEDAKGEVNRGRKFTLGMGESEARSRSVKIFSGSPSPCARPGRWKIRARQI